MRRKKLSKSTMNKLTKSWIGMLIVIGFLGFQYYQQNQPINPGERFEVTLDKCVDGDTAWFIFKGESIKVRFLFIDTPESTSTVEPYGEEASKFVETKLSNAKTIELELNKDGDQYDKYNRMLAWVFVDDKLLQEEIAINGYVEKFYDYGYKYTYKSKIVDANNLAKDNKVGIYR